MLVRQLSGSKRGHQGDFATLQSTSNVGRQGVPSVPNSGPPGLWVLQT